MYRIPFVLLAMSACGDDGGNATVDAPMADSHTCSCFQPGCPAAECQPRVVADMLGTPVSVAVDGLHYYVTTADTVFRTTTARTGSPTMIATAQAGPRSIKTLHRGTTTEVYWANQTSGEIMRLVIAADQSVGSPVAIADDAPGVFSLDVTLGNVFWSNTSTGEIWQLPLDGGGAPGKQTIVASGQNKPAWFLCNESNPYWTNTSGGQVMSATFNVGNGTWSAKPIFSGLVGPSEIEIDGLNMYFISDSGTSVMMAAKIGPGLFDPPTPLVTNQIGLAAFECNENSLNWANGAGEIVSAPRDTGTGMFASPLAIASGQGTTTVGLAYGVPESGAAPTLGWITSSGGGQVLELSE